MSNLLFRHYIAGTFVESKRRFDNVSPVNGRVLGQVCEAGEHEVNAAVEAAKLAQSGPWGGFSAAQRAELLERIADGIERRFNDFVAGEVGDLGGRG